MKILFSVFLGFFIFFLLGNPVSPAFAQIQVQAQGEASSAATTKDDSVGMINILIKFLENIDKFAAGGLVFTTPDVFSDTITFPGGGAIPGYEIFRKVFLAISVSIVALVLAVMGTSLVFEEGTFQIKPLLVRLFFVGALFAGLSPLLSLTIQGTNLLNNQILALGSQAPPSQDFGRLAIAILQDISAQLMSGADPASFGIVTVNISLFGNAVQSVGLFLFSLFLFIITVLFLLFGFFFILFQFVIRFVSLLFLSILYPFVIPFALSPKTEGIVRAYFMAWIGFLIHQPAFILGYMIVLNIFNSLLGTEGASLGMLFFYSGTLFFLGGINVLVNRIFGEPWTAIGTSIQSAAATGVLSEPVARFKHGMVGGSPNGFTSLAGRSFAQKSGLLSRDGKQFSLKGGVQSSESDKEKNNESVSSGSTGGINRKSSSSFMPELSKELGKKGIGVSLLDKKTGAVEIKPVQGFAYTDKNTGLITKYFSKEDALKDGRTASELQQTTIEGKYLDYSAFYKTGQKNPYNTYTGKIKKDTGYSGHSHVKFTSNEPWMNDHLVLGQDRFKSEGVKGIIGKRYGNNQGKTKDRIIRIYTRK